MSDDQTIAEARLQLEAAMYDKGAECPCCTQFVKVYRRKINAGIAKILIAVYRKGGDDWVYLPTVDGQTGGIRVSRSGEVCTARFWGLLEPQPADARADGSSRVGWWRLTPSGVSFVQGTSTIPKYALVYNNRCLELTGEQMTIRAALGDQFDYAELMGRQR